MQYRVPAKKEKEYNKQWNERGKLDPHLPFNIYKKKQIELCVRRKGDQRVVYIYREGKLA